MFRSKLIVPALAVACLLASQAVVPSMALASAPVRAIVATAPATGTAPAAKIKMVHLNLANKTNSALDVTVGETPVTVAAGETVKLSAPTGAKIVVATATATHPAGDLLAQVSSDLSGATLNIN
jgi:hypothetical protein